MAQAETCDDVQPFAPPDPVCFVNHERAKGIMAEDDLDALFASEDENLYYLSGHAPDSVLAHFYEPWACAIYPRHDGVPPTLITGEYDMTYCLTHPTWMETRFYGTEWTAISTMLKKVHGGMGLGTELHGPLRELYEATLPKRKATYYDSVIDFLETEMPRGDLRIGFDDLRMGGEIRERIGPRLQVVDGKRALRRIRLVKTGPEIEILKQGIVVNENAVRAAGAAVKEGRSCMEMVNAYRDAVQRGGGKWLGERGMLFGAGPDGSFVLDHDYTERMTFERGQTVILDCICLYRMYHADSARTASVGEASAYQKMMHDVVKEAVAAGEDNLKAGAHSADLERLGMEVFEKSGLPTEGATVIYHPIGLNVFDFGTPEAAADGWVMETDTMVNFEVFYRHPEHGGMHMEDTTRVTETGLERFTTLPHEIIVAG